MKSDSRFKLIPINEVPSTEVNAGDTVYFVLDGVEHGASFVFGPDTNGTYVVQVNGSGEILLTSARNLFVEKSEHVSALDMLSLLHSKYGYAMNGRDLHNLQNTLAHLRTMFKK